MTKKHLIDPEEVHHETRKTDWADIALLILVAVAMAIIIGEWIIW